MESEVHKFRLPLPPSANVIWKQNYTRRTTYINPIYEQWLNDCKYMMPRIKHRGHRSWDLDITFFFYYVHKIANMDVDNRIKPLIDFIKDWIKIDDRWNRNGSWKRIDVQAPKQRKDHYCDVILTIY